MYYIMEKNSINNIEKENNDKYILLQKNSPDKLIGDKFWSDDINVLFNNNRITEFYPSYDMTLIEKLNSIVRLSVYLSIVLYLFTQNYLYLYIAIVIFAFTLFIFKNQRENIEMYFNSYNSVLNDHNKRILEKKKCTNKINSLSKFNKNTRTNINFF